jgi:cell division septum initiation protein DivIVA
MDDEMNTQLRTITFSEERKGFDKDEVRQYLTEVADWIEGGGGDLVRRRLERIAHKSANMLADAEDGAEGLRREAEHEARVMLETAKSEADESRTSAEVEAREQLRDARAEATSCREAANQYAAESGRKADEYAEQTRQEAKRESDELREESAQAARQTVRSAEQRADQIVADATRQREAIETVIGDLGLERDAVVSQVRKFAQELEETVDGLDGDSGARAPKPVLEEVEPVELDLVDEKKSVEELRVGSGPMRRGNGAGPA